MLQRSHKPLMRELSGGRKLILRHNGLWWNLTRRYLETHNKTQHCRYCLAAGRRETIIVLLLLWEVMRRGISTQEWYHFLLGIIFVYELNSCFQKKGLFSFIFVIWVINTGTYSLWGPFRHSWRSTPVQLFTVLHLVVPLTSSVFQRTELKIMRTHCHSYLPVTGCQPLLSWKLFT